MSLFRTKTVEQSIADTDDPEHQPAARTVGRGPDGLRDRRRHRHRHLRAHRQGGRGPGRAGRRHLLRGRRVRLRARRPLLRRVRLHRAGRGVRLHVQLRDARRAHRVDHRLGPHPRARARREHGGGRLVRLLRRTCSTPSGSPCPESVYTETPSITPAEHRGGGDRARSSPASSASASRSRPGSTTSSSRSRSRSCCSSSSPGSSTSRRATTRRSSRRPAPPPRQGRDGDPLPARRPRRDDRHLRRRRASSPAPPWSSSPSSASTSSRRPPRRPANPQRDLPRGILGSLAICTMLYVAVSLVVTGHGQVQPDEHLRAAGRGVPLGRPAGVRRTSSRIGALAGLTTVMMILMLGQSRVFFAMSRDRPAPAVVLAGQPAHRHARSG